MRRETQKHERISFFDWICADGNCYIDTGLTNSSDTTSIELEFGIIPTNDNSGNSELIAISRSVAGLQVYIGIYYGAFSILNQSSDVAVNSGTYYEIETYTTASLRRVRIKDGSWVDQTFSRSISDGSKIYLLGAPGLQIGSKNDRLYYLKIKRNNVYVRNYRPAMKDGLAGLYDDINDRFDTTTNGLLTLGND